MYPVCVCGTLPEEGSIWAAMERHKCVWGAPKKIKKVSVIAGKKGWAPYQILAEGWQTNEGFWAEAWQDPKCLNSDTLAIVRGGKANSWHQSGRPSLRGCSTQARMQEPWTWVGGVRWGDVWKWTWQPLLLQDVREQSEDDTKVFWSKQGEGWSC